MANSSYRKVLVTIALLASCGSANPIFQRDLALPSQDPFYYPPEGFESKPPGTILNHRPPPSELAAFGEVPLNLASAHQILYRTTSACGSATHTVSTVLIPHGANLSRVVSQQDFMDTACFDCSTSYALQQHASQRTVQSQASILYIAGLLKHKYVVNIPDYEGPKASFASGLSSGYALLDSIRALLCSSDITGISPNADVVMWGYSGGSIPTAWAAELHAKYAPELKILGASIGGTIGNVEATIRSITKSENAGFAFSGIIGIGEEYPTLKAVLTADLVPETAKDFWSANTRCAVPNSLFFLGKDIAKFFRSGFALFSNPEVKRVITETGTLGLRDTPRMPLYIYKSVNDAIAPIAVDDALVTNYCANGGQVQYKRNLKGSHPLESVLGAPPAVVFLKNLLEGKGAPSGCSTTNVSFISPNWNDIKEMGEDVTGLLTLLLSKQAMVEAEYEVKEWWRKETGY
ncbi:hypothetical protein DSL72_006434 [Monilinia vaccinii-corymbosi]|uniref:Uncharacterized protein n=1 Tax=Monilinia vaccinii-corymbosi TaxID=61207 RepID=A0A8A3PNR0_9HELO|nr:hypothetical protein DSL72_006434 [Monilinia vaccinii-corymbosi]